MKKAAPWIVVLLVVAGLAAWFLLKRPAPDEHPSVVELPSTETGKSDSEPRYPVEEIAAVPEQTGEPLPALEESDDAVIASLADLFGPEALGRVLVTEQVVSRIVATVDRMDSRELSPLVMPVKPPPGEFRVRSGDTTVVSSENFGRYDPYIALARAAPVAGAAAFYRRHYPLFQQAYEDLGYEDAYFNDRLVAIIDHVLAAPEPEQLPMLQQSESVYVYADESLEALSAGQKLLLRMGPSQAAVVREKLRAFRAAIASGEF